MISYRIGFSECEHRRASNSQHARKRLFTGSRPACQGQNSGRGRKREQKERKLFSPALSHREPPRSSEGAGGSHMRRSIAAILAIPTLLNGLAMLVAGPFWYANVPGATETGPFNPHFVQDIGVGVPGRRSRARRAGLAAALLAGRGRGRRLPRRPCPDPPGRDHRRTRPPGDVRPSRRRPAGGARPLLRLPCPRRNIMRSWIARRMLRRGKQALRLRHELSRDDAEGVAGRILQVRSPDEGRRPSRGGSGRSQLCGQDHRRAGGGLRPLHATRASTWRWKPACRRTRSRRSCAATRRRHERRHLLSAFRFADAVVRRSAERRRISRRRSRRNGAKRA